MEKSIEAKASDESIATGVGARVQGESGDTALGATNQ